MISTLKSMVAHSKLWAIAGGHGAAVDFPHNKVLSALVSKLYADGKAQPVQQDIYCAILISKPALLARSDLANS